MVLYLSTKLELDARKALVPDPAREFDSRPSFIPDMPKTAPSVKELTLMLSMLAQEIAKKKAFWTTRTIETDLKRVTETQMESMLNHLRQDGRLPVKVRVC